MAENKAVIDIPIKECRTKDELNEYREDVEINENLEYFHTNDKTGNLTGGYDSDIVNYVIQVDNSLFLKATPCIHEEVNK